MLLTAQQLGMVDLKIYKYTTMYGGGALFQRLTIAFNQ